MLRSFAVPSLDGHRGLALRATGVIVALLCALMWVAPQASWAAGPPLASPKVTAVPLDAAVSVSWVAPDANGSVITGYVLTAYANGVLASSYSLPATPLAKSVTGLTNGVRYEFTVAAVNGLGTGAVSARSVGVIAGVPGYTGKVVAKDSLGGVCGGLFGWDPAVPQGAPVTSYKMAIYKDGGFVRYETFTPADPYWSDSSPAAAVDLSSSGAGSYTFKVAGINKYGLGKYSGLSAAVALTCSAEETYYIAVPTTAPTGIGLSPIAPALALPAATAGGGLLVPPGSLLVLNIGPLPISVLPSTLDFAVVCTPSDLGVASVCAGSARIYALNYSQLAQIPTTLSLGPEPVNAGGPTSTTTSTTPAGVPAPAATPVSTTAAFTG